MRVKSGRLITLPYSFDINDGINFRGNVEAEEFADATIAMFDRLLRGRREQGRVMCIPIHPFILGQPHRIRHLDRILRHIASQTASGLRPAARSPTGTSRTICRCSTAHLAEMRRA